MQLKRGMQHAALWQEKEENAWHFICLRERREDLGKAIFRDDNKLRVCKPMVWKGESEDGGIYFRSGIVVKVVGEPFRQ